MNPIEHRAVASLALLYATRMLGLFMIYPVFKTYAGQLVGANSAFIVGIAMSGAYGWMQAFLQIPFGLLSDRIGRKPMIIAGLCLFAVGSVVAAMSHTIYGVIIGRAIQGSGAISGTVLAMLADLTREEQRTKAMAVIGMSIGLSISIAMPLGSLLGYYTGLEGIFWATAVMAISGVGVLLFLVPTPISSRVHRDVMAVPAQLQNVLHNKELLRFNWGIFVVHFIFAANFIVLPTMLSGLLDVKMQGVLYLLVMLIAFVVIVPFIILAEKKRHMKAVFLSAIFFLSASEAIMSQAHRGLIELVIILFVFFMAFNLLEATLPSLVSKTCPAGLKGTAMSVYSCCQFLGISFGGAAGGWMLDHSGVNGVLILGSAFALVWFFIGLFMAPPPYLASYVVKLKEGLGNPESVVQTLMNIRGIADAVVVEDNIAYLKVDHQQLDKVELERYSLIES